MNMDVILDILIIVKVFGGGFLIGVMIIIDKFVNVFVVGDYGMIYGGNLLVFVVVNVVFGLINILEVLNGVCICV